MAHTHHAIDYVELTVPDLPGAKTFYATAFGWGLTDYGDAYVGIQGGADEQGGLRPDPQAKTPLPLVYSDDIEKTRDAVKAAGGTIVDDIFDFPGGRRFHFADPAGNQLGVYTGAD